MTGLGETERTQGHEESRREESKMKLCDTNIATYNVQTLFQTGKFDQLTRQAKLLPTDIIAVQEHRWITSEPVSQTWSENREFLFVYSSASKSRVGGVGLLIRRQHVGAFRSAEKISDRVLKVYFAGNPMITIVVAYAPTELSSSDAKDTFYNDMALALVSASTQYIIIVLV